MPETVSRVRCACGDCALFVPPGREFAAGHATAYATALRNRVFQNQDRYAYAELYRRGWLLTEPDNGMSFGVEAEFFGIARGDALSLLRAQGHNVQDDGYHHTTRPFWRITQDNSVNAEANELVSPILRVGKTHMKEVRSITTILRRNGGRVDRSCGLHIHHSVSKMDLPAVIQTVGHWSLFQPTINTLIPASRRGANYARPMFGAQHWMNVIQRRVSDIEGFRTRGDDFGRYHSINLNAIRKHGTLEFRQHSGTLNGKKIEMWTRFTKLFTLLASRGKRCEDLLRTYDMHEPSVNSAYGLTGMLSYIGASPEMVDFYIKRQEKLDKNDDVEDHDANVELTRLPGDPQNGDTDASRTQRWCAFHRDWHPHDQWSTHNARTRTR